MIFLRTVLILSLLFYSGCGYSTKSVHLTQTKNIYVSNFVNKIPITSEPSNENLYKTYTLKLEIDVTGAIINKFIADGNMRISKEKDADLVLKGDLVNFRRDVLRYTDTQDVQEYRLSIIINMQLVDNKTNNVIWTENNFVGDSAYFLTGPLAKSEQDALNEAIADLATRVVERTIEAW